MVGVEVVPEFLFCGLARRQGGCQLQPVASVFRQSPSQCMSVDLAEEMAGMVSTA